jgi:hypothetical protein
MTVAALIDLGADKEVLMSALSSLNVTGYTVKIGRTQKCGIDACDFNVILDSELHQGHPHEHSHSHTKPDIKKPISAASFRMAPGIKVKASVQEHVHSHDHSHVHGDNPVHGGNHEHRNLYDIYRIIDASGITHGAKTVSKKIYEVVAIAESKAHGLGIAEVHFHEVGAVDSIVDIVAAAVCIDNLGINDVIVSEMYEGTGHVKCQHGILPVPVPAVLNIISANSLPIRITDESGEIITPTGVAIAAALRTKESLPNRYTIKAIGLGAGKKDFKKANVLRAYIIEESKKSRTMDSVWLLETNLDDCTGENLGYVMEKLLDEGANDVFYTPIYMKKNRPAYKLSVICKESDKGRLASIIFRNTTSTGIRTVLMERDILERESLSFNTDFGPVRVKVTSFDGEKSYSPEYEDIRNFCKNKNLPYREVYESVMASVRNFSK